MHPFTGDRYDAAIIKLWDIIMRYRATTANQVLFENIVLHYLADYYNRKLFFWLKMQKKIVAQFCMGSLQRSSRPPSWI